MNDVRGAVFQLVRSSDNAPIAINPDGTYKGNVVADMQIMVAKAINDGLISSTPQLQTAVNTLSSTITDWASSKDDVYKPQYRCNGDSMHHVVKGMTIIRVDDAVGFRIRQNKIGQVYNFSPASFQQCFDYHKGFSITDKATLQQGAIIRGIAVSAVTGYEEIEKLSMITKNSIKKFYSRNAPVIVGIDVQGMSDSLVIERNKVNLNIGIGEDTTDKYVALRVREDVNTDLSFEEHKNIMILNNTFSQEVETMKVYFSQVKKRCPNASKNEWEVGQSPGGCPFGLKKTTIFDIAI